MGWNGDIVDTCDDSVDNEFNCDGQATATDADVQVANKNITYMTTALTSKQYQHFYCGFANNVLWLLLHEQAHLISQAPEDYAGYQAVNQLFAKQLKKIIQPDDVIWVHDYHFLSVAYYCRQLGLNNRIGLFLHIPFAPLTFWQKLDQSPELIKHLAHYDVFGTQTEQDKENCLAVFNHYLKDSYLNTRHLTDSMSKTDSMLKTNNMLKESTNNPAHIAQNFAKSNRSTGAQLELNLDLDAPHHIMIDAYPIGIDVDKIQQQVINSSSYLSSQYKRQMPEKTDIKTAVQQ
ncbi:trehalose-6-phosphate synthase, partial [Psychrobacter sp. 1U2]